MSENRARRKILGPKRDDATGELRELPDEELNDQYCSPNIIRVMKSRRMIWAGHVARMGRGLAYRACVGKTEGKGPRGRPRHKLEGNIKMDL